MSGRFTFPRSLRVIRRRDFDAIYAGRVRVSSGPLVIWAAPNGVSHCRLGLAINRRAGSAVARNRIRRLIREAFRLLQHELPREPCGYDLAVSVRPHRPAGLDVYRDALRKGIGSIEEKWAARRRTT